jgi:O-antigen/teichoic acid export membrane protein
MANLDAEILVQAAPMAEVKASTAAPGWRYIPGEVKLAGLEESEVSRAWTAARAALLTTAANFLMTGLGVLSGVMAARLLGPKGRGELAAIQAWPSALASLSLLGTSEAVLYWCARQPARKSAYLNAALLIGAPGALVFSAVGFVAMPWLLASQNSTVVWGSRVFLFQIWMFLLMAMPSQVLRAAGSFTQWNLLRLCPMVVWIAIFAVAWLLNVHRAVPLAFSYIVAGWLVLVPELLLLRREGFSLTMPRRQELRQTLEFGLPVVGTSVPQMLNLRLDQILMAGLLPAAALGHYVVAVAWSGAGLPLVQGLSAVVVPKLAARTDHDAFNGGRDLARATRIGMVISLLTGGVLLALASLGIRFFFGVRFISAVPAARLLAVAGAITSLNVVLSEGMRGLGRPVSVLRAEMAALIVTAVGLWLLLRPLGIYGAALVSLLAYATAACWLLAEAYTVTGITAVEFLFPRRADLRVLTQAMSELVKRGRGTFGSMVALARTAPSVGP